VQLKRRLSQAGRAAKPALAGLLAVLVLAFGFLAAHGPLHRSLHNDGTAGASLCVLCLFAQGQVDSTDIAPALVLCVFILLSGVLAACAGVPWSVDLLLPPGRAPPCFSSVS
jgi:hypothetical protein